MPSSTPLRHASQEWRSRRTKRRNVVAMREILQTSMENAKHVTGRISVYRDYLRRMGVQDSEMMESATKQRTRASYLNHAMRSINLTDPVARARVRLLWSSLCGINDQLQYSSEKVRPLLQKAKTQLLSAFREVLGPDNAAFQRAVSEAAHNLAFPEPLEISPKKKQRRRRKKRDE